LDFLADTGVPTIGLNALIHSGSGLTVGTGLKESELQPILDIATRKTDERGQRLIWYTPTQYCEFDPTANNLGVKGCTAALYSMCIESNGNVLPCQSYYHSLEHAHRCVVRSGTTNSLQLRTPNLPAKCEGCPWWLNAGSCPCERKPPPEFRFLPILNWEVP
jgi:radical SAM protein with 4Fe4S-binding SPASM domain